MRTLLACCATLLFLLNNPGQASAIFPSVDSAKTCIRFDSLRLNFGTVKAGEIVKLRYRFVNCGKKPLEIEYAHGSSGAIVCQYPRKPVQPDSSSFVDVTFNTIGKSGEHSKTAVIKIRGSRETVVLYLYGAVIPNPSEEFCDPPCLDFESDTKDFGTVKKGAEVRLEYEFKNCDKKPVTIASVITNTGAAVADWPKEAIAPGRSGIIKVKFDTNAKQGAQNKTFNVYVQSSPFDHMIPLYMKGNVGFPADDR